MAEPAVEEVEVRRTYWCHSCDMSVSLLSHQSLVATCPHCQGGNDDSLELMDDTPLSPPGARLPSSSVLLRHLLRRISALSSAAAASVAAVTIAPSSELLHADCAVCKDRFALGADARRLPCGHVYHAGCILPWLAHHDSCPLCRFRLPPTDEADVAAEEIALTNGEDWFEDYATTLTYIARKHNLLPPAPEIDGAGGPAGDDVTSTSAAQNSR